MIKYKKRDNKTYHCITITNYGIPKTQLESRIFIYFMVIELELYQGGYHALYVSKHIFYKLEGEGVPLGFDQNLEPGIHMLEEIWLLVEVGESLITFRTQFVIVMLAKL